MSRSGPTAQTRYELEQIKPLVAQNTPQQIASITGIRTDKIKYLIRHHPWLLLPEQKPPQQLSGKCNTVAKEGGGNWGDSPDDFFLIY
jgi:hypothetical protein